MCNLSNETIDITGYHSIAILALPLIFSLYFGKGNVYKILFLMLASYIIILILIIANVYRGILCDVVVNYEDQFGDKKEKKLIFMGLMEDPKMGLNDVQSFDLTYYLPLDLNGINIKDPLSDFEKYTITRKKQNFSFNNDENIAVLDCFKLI